MLTTVSTETDRAQILRAVDEKTPEIAAFLARLIQFDSETGKEGPIQEFIAGYLKGMGLEVDSGCPTSTSWRSILLSTPRVGRDFSGRPNVVGVYRGDRSAKSLLFNGHVDTIPLTPVTDWQFDPLSGELKDGRILGRGSSDMKGGLAAMTLALKTLLDTGLAPRGSVILEYVMDEEVSGLGTLACVTRGYKADAGISLETSDLHVQPACIGRLWFVVDVRGKPAGISRRWEAVSALDKGFKIAKAIEDLEGLRIGTLTHPLFPDNRGALPCAVGKFEAGHYASATPDRAILRGSMGLLPQEDIEEVKKDFQAFIRSVCELDPWLKDHPPTVWFEGLIAEGAEIPRDHPDRHDRGAGLPRRHRRRADLHRTDGCGRHALPDPPRRHADRDLRPRRDRADARDQRVAAARQPVIATKTLALTIHDWCK